MITCADIIDECSAQLHGWGSTQDRITPLADPMTAGATSFTVDFSFGQAVGITPGVVQIDSELVYVSSVDASSNTCTIADGFGRGYDGTTATSHAAGAKVISRPKFPRTWLFKQVNEIIGGLYPQLFVVNTYTGTIKSVGNTYDLGSVNGTPMSIIDAQWQDPIGDWHSFYSYQIDPYDGTFRLGSGGWAGRPLRVMYVTQPRQFTSETDVFETATGLPSSAKDVLTLGVVAMQVPGLDISRAQLTSVEQSDRSRVIPPNAGQDIGKYLMAEYQNRLANEAASLRKQYRSRIVRRFT